MEVVIKSLSLHYQEVEGLTGASILGNGSIALIVDVQSLLGMLSRPAAPGGILHRTSAFPAAFEEQVPA